MTQVASKHAYYIKIRSVKYKSRLNYIIPLRWMIYQLYSGARAPSIEFLAVKTITICRYGVISVHLAYTRGYNKTHLAVRGMPGITIIVVTFTQRTGLGYGSIRHIRLTYGQGRRRSLQAFQVTSMGRSISDYVRTYKSNNNALSLFIDKLCNNLNRVTSGLHFVQVTRDFDNIIFYSR